MIPNKSKVKWSRLGEINQNQETQEELQDEEKQPQQQQQLQQQQQQPNAMGGLLEEDILGLNLVSNGGLPETMISAGVSNR